MTYAFAGDRKIAVRILEHLMAVGYKPSLLLVSKGVNETHADELIELSELKDSLVLKGKEFSDPDYLKQLKNLELDYIISIHFPYIIPEEVLQIPKIGFLNLHPSYLPFNKGWHTPSWAILNGEPYGATLHFMTAELDKGDIIHQRKLPVLPGDTANSLYQRVLELEFAVFTEALPMLASLDPPRTPQVGEGSSHMKKDLKNLQLLDLDKQVRSGDLINRLRALTTNDIAEACIFERDGKKYSVQLHIEELKNEQ